MTTETTVAPPPWSLMVGVASQPGNTIGLADGRQAEAGDGEQTEKFRFTLSRIAETHDDFDYAKPANPTAGFGDDGFGLDDLVDMVNPLQHLPFISTAYRAFTGDEISSGARIAGGTLYGGPVGLAMAAINGALEAQTGRDVGETLASAFFGAPEPEDGPDFNDGTAVAAIVEGAEIAESQADLDRAADQLAAMTPAAANTAPPASAPTPNPVQSPFFPSPRGPLIQTPSTGPLLARQQSEQASAPTQSPLSVTAQNVPNLSSDAAAALMRMVSNTQQTPPVSLTELAASPDSETVVVAPPSPPRVLLSEVQAEVLQPAPPAITPPTITPPAITPPPSEARTNNPSPTTAASARSPIGFVEPVATADLPGAMMEALKRYESMKQGG